MTASPDLRLGEACLVDWTFDEYLASPLVSRSALEAARRHGWSYFYGRHIASVIPPAPQSAAMRRGTALHTLVLEPARAQALVWEFDPAQPESQARRALERGAVVLSREDLLMVRGMATAVGLDGRATRYLLRDGLAEQTVLWREPETGIVVRVRLDYVVEDDGIVTVTDLKSFGKKPTPELFTRRVANFGYHRQGAMYTDAVRALWPAADVHFVLVVVSNTFPHEVACYELTDALEVGRVQYKRTLRELAERLAANDWCSSWESEIQVLDLPRWANYEE